MKPTDIKKPEYFHKIIDCQYACPTHTPVPQYIQHIARREYDQAYIINWISNVFPGVLGRICDRPCEPACRRGRIEETPVAICRLKRLAADKKSSIDILPTKCRAPNGKKIALIGGGPASLTVARDLRLLGYEIHLFDQQKKAGGFIRTQVPSFRLPEKILEEEVDIILNMGVITHFNGYISSLKSILGQNFDAVFVGTGAPRGRDLAKLPGREAGRKNIAIGTEWLAAVLYRHVKKIGPRVLVLGGGNTAMDCCRTARRLGGENVSIIVRSPKETMKASLWEIEEALLEGVHLIDNHLPLAFVTEGDRLTGMNFDRVEARQNDRGERELISSGEAPVFIPCDDVILAVGQENAFPWIERDIGLHYKNGLPLIDPETLQSNIPRLFFGGDAAFGPKNVITAVAHGHQAAISIDLFCQGQSLDERPPTLLSLSSQKMGLQEWAYDNDISIAHRNKVPRESPVKSIRNRLMEVELGFDQEVGLQEASRCLNCDIQTVFEAATCIECDACVDICPVSCINFMDSTENELRTSLRIPAENLSQALYVSEPTPIGHIMVKDENVCLHCALCANRCPTSSWQMLKSTLSYPGQK
ncbi:FAD-dependent oxidoreductase [Desulfotalea psychrophila]|uniref:Probable glutamate synthase, small chain n=1 Tax=Desulfotalea psychrophila (strain LSv54 / DSM 12343) TaxID=177439 RepID=Q6APV2_DESPS|nr:FAD-dependent oxidoreductase [Desulfotalea psychrophila]CAG35622.1 probable glutamate synthase, small chain [Desulfotalea psychrophila LSv54]